jgi:hypothetical protein
VPCPSIPRQSTEARANVSSAAHEGVGATVSVYVSQKRACPAWLQSAVVVQVSPRPASAWHVPSTHWSASSQGVVALQVWPFADEATHFDVPSCGAQYAEAGHWSPGSAQTSPSCFGVGVTHVMPETPGAAAHTSPLAVQSKVVVHAASWAAFPTKTLPQVVV